MITINQSAIETERIRDRNPSTIRSGTRKLHETSQLQQATRHTDPLVTDEESRPAPLLVTSDWPYPGAASNATLGGYTYLANRLRS